MGYQRRVHGDRSPRRTKMRLISVVICGLFYSALANNEKQPKNIGIFNVVRFPNAACEGSNGNMGTCYTAEECEDNSGTASGSCADGYGVCCIFSINCAGTSSQNLTMFMSNNVAAGACSAEICKTNSDIVQLRSGFHILCPFKSRYCCCGRSGYVCHIEWGTPDSGGCWPPSNHSGTMQPRLFHRILSGQCWIT